MDKREQVLAAINELGYKAEIDKDGDIAINYQMKKIYAITGNPDENYLVMMLPQFYDIEEDEVALTLATCNKVTRELKLLKAYIESNYKAVTATCEFFYFDDNSLKQNIEQSLSLLGLVRTAFRKAKDVLAE